MAGAANPLTRLDFGVDFSWRSADYCKSKNVSGTEEETTDAMDELSLAFYDLKFHFQYVTAEGDRFQELFVSIMERAHPGDFARVQPWGNLGDLKCDGYLASKDMIFGCYGPKEFKPRAKATAKVSADHSGAVKHWKKHGMAAWTFVHNDHQGLPAWLLQLLLKLGAKDLSVEVSHWGHPELALKVRSLSKTDLIALFGAVPTARDVLALRQEDLKRVIPAISGALAMEQVSADFRPVPPEKIEFNKLSDDARLLLTHGMQVSQRVRMFFDRYEPGIGDKIAAGFKRRYEQLRADSTTTPDQILWQLFDFAGRPDLANPREMSAALAVLAFLFESCEIFERPPDAMAHA